MKSISDGKAAGDDPAVLSIGEVSRRTGIPVAGLRNWEQRYGLPRPERLPNGRRRYRESDCQLLDEVLRGRAQGLSLAAAVAHALTGGGSFRDMSIFAGLRRRHPALQVHVMTKTMLLAVTHAIEDECCARAQRPVLVGSFQRPRFYRQAQPRWIPRPHRGAGAGLRRFRPARPAARLTVRPGRGDPDRRGLPVAPRVGAGLRRTRPPGLPGGLGAPRAGDPGGPGPHLRDGVVGRSPGGAQRRPHRRRAGRRGGVRDPGAAPGPAGRRRRGQLGRPAPGQRAHGAHVRLSQPAVIRSSVRRTSRRPGPRP